MIQQKKKTKQTTQEWRSKMKPTAAAKIRMRAPRTMLETVNK